MSNAEPPVSPSSAPADVTAIPGTLREDIEKRRAADERYTIRETVAIIVPLCTDLIERHHNGETFFVHPSSIRFAIGSKPKLIDETASKPPSHPRDKACQSPEERTSKKGGDSRASVFSIGAIAYEMLTGQAVGPAMRRPTELVPHLPPILDTVLSKALIGDPEHRPADLAALAQAIHHLAPMASMPPPTPEEAALDDDEDLAVDVSLSMMPPAPQLLSAMPRPGALPRPAALPRDLMPASELVDVAEAPKGPQQADATSTLADLKGRLEADPRPRYVVIKDGMDHGPFSALELLQQIASHTFEAHHILVDTFSSDERAISDWDEFSPFAEQARLNREIKAEKKEIERAVVAESKATRSKALVIGLSLAGVAALAVVVFLVAFKPKDKREGVVLDGPLALNIETDAGIKGATGKKPGKYGGSTGVGPGGRPVLAGGMSCEQAMDTYVTELKMAGNKPDLTAGQYGGALNNGSYVIACGAPASMTVNICAAIQNGRAVGVSVSTSPSNPGVASCIASRVRGMGFPSHPALDVTRTTFQGN